MKPLVPDMSRTLVPIGDQHFYAAGFTAAPKANTVDRAFKYQERVLALGVPAGVLNIGDITEEGRPEEYAAAAPWWAAWPNPKAICPGNHDIDAGFGTMTEWESHFGDRTQVIDTPHFRVVSCLWTGTGHGGRGINQSDGFAEVGAIIGASVKPTALAFHYSVRGTWDQNAEPYAGAITQAGMDNVSALIGAHDNLQLVLTGHTHVIAWMAATPASQVTAPIQGGLVGTNGRRCWHQNLSATTYVAGLGDIRSPLLAFPLTFFEDRFESRVYDVENKVWRQRYIQPGRPLIEVWPYT